MRRSRKSINQINVVPYIDVMLVLLVIFMVTAPLMQPGQIELPTVGSALTQPPALPIEIKVVANGGYTVSDRESKAQPKRVGSAAELLATVRQMQANTDQPVVISAPGSVAYDKVIEVIDVLHRGGIKRVGLLAQPKPG